MSALFPAALGNVQVPDAAIGWEPVSRAVKLLLSRDLSAELTKQEVKWHSSDLKMQELGFDPGVGQTDLEPIPNSHLHEGPHESFLEASADKFPNVSIMAYLNTPSASQLFDSLDTSDITLFVETMVKAGPVAAGTETAFETLVHRRIQRTTEAVNNVIRRDATLLGTVLPQQLPPRGGIGQQSWIRPSPNEGGQRFMWHGSRLQYTLQRASTTG